MLAGIIAALNSVNTPWIAIAVIVLGMVFEVVCKVYGLSSDSATGVIGAGIGLLTGQGIHALNQLNGTPQNPTQPPASGPTK